MPAVTLSSLSFGTAEGLSPSLSSSSFPALPRSPPPSILTRCSNAPFVPSPPCASRPSPLLLNPSRFLMRAPPAFERREEDLCGLLDELRLLELASSSSSSCARGGVPENAGDKGAAIGIGRAGSARTAGFLSVEVRHGIQNHF
eukprot:368217-Rhodomonas_salina.7